MLAVVMDRPFEIEVASLESKLTLQIPNFHHPSLVRLISQ